MQKLFGLETNRIINTLIQPCYIRLIGMEKSADEKIISYRCAYEWIASCGPQDDVSVAARLKYFRQIIDGLSASRGLKGIDKILRFYDGTVFWVDDHLYHRARGTGVTHQFDPSLDEAIWNIKPSSYIDEFPVLDIPAF